MLLRALTVLAVVIGLVFVAWSLLVMTGGRDWLVAAITTDEKTPEEVATKEEKPAQPPADAEAPASADDAKPAEQAKPSEEAKPADAAKPDEAAEAEDVAIEEKPAEDADASVDPAGNPAETAKAPEKDSLISPYQDSYTEVAEEGHKKYMAAGCNGCHGGTGGGGMGPPLSNPVWIYGNDGDTLFRLIALGTDEFQEQGYTRKGSENVVGPMPAHGTIVKSNDDMWKIIAWIWSINPPDKSAQ